jgi:hypothetical protein
MQTEDFSDRGFRNKFLAKENRDDLEQAFVDAAINEAATKLLRQIASELPEFKQKVALEVARRSLDIE